MSAPATCQELIDLVEKSGLYEFGALKSRLRDVGIRNEAPADVAAKMVRHGLITKFQAKLLLQGKYRGFRIGPYVLSDMIGQGGMGSVYDAKHIQLDRRVAVKVLTPGKDENVKLAIERFMREARAAAALDHPNIVRLHDVGQFGSTPYLVMEFVEGETLEQIVEKKGSLPCQKAVDYICQAAAGLQHAHEKGFIHRDIKPSNLILTKDGTIKLLDMGLARSSDEKDKLTGKLDLNTIVGTADYISPEQAINDPDIDIRSDIYSLGATFFTLVTGGSPFKGNTAQKLVQHQIKEAPSLTRMDKTLPKELADVVMKMMAKKKEQRYRTPADVIAAFSKWLPNSGKVVAGLTQTNAGKSDNDTMDQIVASSTKRITKTILQASENPKVKWAMIGGIASGILVVGAGLGYWMFGGSTKNDNVVNNQTANNGPNTPQSSSATNNQNRTATSPNATSTSTQKRVSQPFSTARSPGSLFLFVPDQLVGNSFKLQGQETIDGVKPNLPAFLQLHCWKPESLGECRIESLNGIPAISMGNRSDVTSAQIRFDFEADDASQWNSDREYEFRFVYKTIGGCKGNFSVLTQKSHQYLKGHSLGETSEWKTESVLFRRGSEPLSCNFDVQNATEKGFISVAKFEVIDVEAAKQVMPDYQVTFQSIANQVKTVSMPGQNYQDFKGFNLPPKMRLNHFDGTATAEYAIRTVGGVKAFEMKLLEGRHGAQAHFDYEKDQPWPVGTPGLIKLKYQYDGPNSGLIAIEEGRSEYKKYFNTSLPKTGREWRTIEIPITRPDTAAPLSIIVSPGSRNNNSSETSSIAIASLEVFRLDSSNATTAAPPPLAPSRPASTGSQVYELPITGTKLFDMTYETGKPPEGVPPAWKGVNLRCWKQGSIGSFRLMNKGDGLELNVTNLNDTPSAQIALNLEYEMGLTFTPGKTYQVVFEYRTLNEGKMDLSYYTGNYEFLRAEPVAETSGRWHQHVSSFAREVDKPLRISLNCQGVGEGNSISIRKVRIVEVK